MIKSKQIVINTCRGEFGLSEEAVRIFANKTNLTLYIKREYIENLYFTKHKSERKNSSDGLWHAKNIRRDHTLLIELVSTMGKRVNSSFSRLEIVDVDNGLNWHIVEEDGREEIKYYE